MREWETAVLAAVAQVPYGGRAFNTTVNFWRKLFLRTYIGHYLELTPGVSRSDIDGWVAPVAAARLDEKIPGEAAALLGLIRSHVAMV